MKDLVKVLDKNHNFRILTEIELPLASSLNVGNTILPNGTGFSFIVVDKFISFSKENSEHILTLNVVEYETFWDKVKRKIFGIKQPHTYWDYYNKTAIYNF